MSFFPSKINVISYVFCAYKKNFIKTFSAKSIQIMFSNT